MVSIATDIYRCDVMNPFVRGGGGPGGPAAAHAQRGARQWAKQWSNSPLPELPPSALAGDRATRRQGKKGPVQACGPELPPSRKTGGVQATSRRRTQNQAAAKASNGTVMHARTPTPGRSRDVRATRRRAQLSSSSRTEAIRGWGDARCWGGDRGGAWRIKFGAAIVVGQIRPGYDSPGA